MIGGEMTSLALRGGDGSEAEAGDTPATFAREIVDIAATSSRSHPHVARLLGVGDAGAIADAIHFVGILHAPRPGAAAIAAERGGSRWLAEQADRFEEERLRLAHRVLTAGPPRRCPDLTRHEALVRQQREAMLVLMRSDRIGCALGAAAALAADWPTIAAVLGLGDLSCDPDPRIAAALAEAAGSPSARRAIGFGMTQLLAVHRTVWDLLQTRQAASLP
jgi:hypothetical protein